MKKIIGVVGEKGAGKETFINLLQEAIASQKTKHLKSSALLSETLELWDLPLTRHNLQYLVIIMNNEFGKGTLTRALAKRMKESKADILIYDSVRLQSDLELIRSFPNNLLVFLTAPLEVRYERTKVRKEKEGEDSATIEEFKAEEQVATEIEIARIGSLADITIKNDGSIEELKKQVEEFCKNYLS